MPRTPRTKSGYKKTCTVRVDQYVLAEILLKRSQKQGYSWRTIEDVLSAALSRGLDDIYLSLDDESNTDEKETSE